jgi:hypothetical protein
MRQTETQDCRICPKMRYPLKGERVVKHEPKLGSNYRDDDDLRVLSY